MLTAVRVPATNKLLDKLKVPPVIVVADSKVVLIVLNVPVVALIPPDVTLLALSESVTTLTDVTFVITPLVLVMLVLSKLPIVAVAILAFERDKVPALKLVPTMLVAVILVAFNKPVEILVVARRDVVVILVETILGRVDVVDVKLAVLIKPVTNKAAEVIPVEACRVLVVAAVIRAFVEVNDVLLILVSSELEPVILVAVKLVTAKEPAVKDPVIFALPPTYKLLLID